MIAVIQRVTRGCVSIDSHPHGSIAKGLVILLGVERGDSMKDACWLAEKCAHLRVFEHEGRFHRSVLDEGGSVLVVSQFTLLGDCRKGRRPGLSRAASPKEAEPLYENFVQALRDTGLTIETGVFGTRMQIELVNEGPVTFIVETEKKNDGS
ncbi:MAG TPA: D-tyrosyl-tRNA(Tyr) deacylase [bacterium]|nr:D-tyrosyl-tRNA(Tyr) deacylase [bacterium]